MSESSPPTYEELAQAQFTLYLKNALKSIEDEKKEEEKRQLEIEKKREERQERADRIWWNRYHEEKEEESKRFREWIKSYIPLYIAVVLFLSYTFGIILSFGSDKCSIQCGIGIGTCIFIVFLSVGYRIYRIGS